MLEVKSPADLQTVLDADIAILDFWAPWCGPCRMLSPRLEAFAEEVPDVLIAKADIDEQPELAQAFNIRSIPTLIVMRKGEHVASVSGVQGLDNLRALVAQAKTVVG